MYRCFFEEDLTHADITANSTIMEETLEKIESGSFPKFQEYMQIASCFLRFGWPNVIEEKLELSSLPDFLSACIRAFPLRSHESVLRDFFASPKVRAMLSFQDLYVGLSPSEAPAVFALLQALELEKGIFYPKGGFAEVSAALKKIAENHGVQISTDSTVKGLHVQNKRVQQAVVVDPKGQRIVEANKFVFNGDVPQTEMNLFVDHNMVDTEVVSARPSCGVVSLHFAFNQTLNGLLHHTLFLSDSYDHSWRTVEHPDNASFDPKKFNFYVHAPSRTDPSCCPAGTDAVTVLVPVPPLGMDDSRKYNTAEIRSAVLSRMEKQLQNMGLWQGNLETAIIGEVVNDPSYFKGKYDLFRGSAFGLTHNLRQLSLLRPGFKHPKLSNCYRVGASTRPGNGVPLVMVGAKLAAKTIMEDTS